LTSFSKASQITLDGFIFNALISSLSSFDILAETVTCLPIFTTFR